jgi:hypothetical protein
MVRCGVERCWGVVAGSEESTPNPPLNLPSPPPHPTLTSHTSQLSPTIISSTSHLPPLHHHSTLPLLTPSSLRGGEEGE